MAIKFFRALPVVLLCMLFSGCLPETHSIEGSDPVFKATDITINNALRGSAISVPSPITISDWHHADYLSENPNINHSFSGKFKITERLSFTVPSKSKDARTSMPIIVDEILYVCNGNGTLNAFRTKDGKFLWDATLHSLGMPIVSMFSTFTTATLSYGDRKIFIATNDGFLFAADAKNGNPVWNVNLESPLKSAFKYKDGILYGTSSSNTVFAINASDGKVLWKYDHPKTPKVTIIKPSILLLKDKVVASFSTGEAVALNKKGKVLWMAEVSHKDGDNLFRIIDIQTTPAKIGSLVMIGGINGNIQFVQEEDGRPVAVYVGSLSSSVSVAGDFAFFMDGESRLICLHIPSGSVKWFKEFTNQYTWPIPAYLNAGNNKISVGFNYGGPILINGQLVLLNQFGELFIIDPQDGEILETKQIPKDIHKNPVVASGKIYLIDDYFGKIIVME